MASDVVLTAGQRLLIADGGIPVVGVDELVWRYAGCGDNCVTVVIYLILVSQGAGSSRLLGVAEGRLKAVFLGWFAQRGQG